jgi:hypothetical protein
MLFVVCCFKFLGCSLIAVGLLVDGSQQTNKQATVTKNKKNNNQPTTSKPTKNKNPQPTANKQ